MDGDFGQKISNLIINAKKIVGTKTPRYESPKEFNKAIDTYCQQIIDEVLSEAFKVSKQTPDLANFVEFKKVFDQRTQNINFKHAGNSGPKFQHHITSFERAINQYSSITNEIKQQTKHDWKAKFRFLILRISTAIGIASVVLATGYIAHEFKIPLPLLKPFG